MSCLMMQILAESFKIKGCFYRKYFKERPDKTTKNITHELQLQISNVLNFIVNVWYEVDWKNVATN